jgi:phosphatidate cytidylyltransferase
MKELTKRILFAVPAAILFLYVTWLGGLFFVGLMTLIMLVMQQEVVKLSNRAGFSTDSYFPYTIGLWVLVAPLIDYAIPIGLVVFLGFIGLQVFKKGERGLNSLVSTFFIGIYAPLGLATFLLIRNTGSSEMGFVLTLSLLLMVWGNDVFAYFGGKSFGKHSLAPAISPNKTWEGFFFGILGATAGLGITIYFFRDFYPVTFLKMLPAVLLVSIFGPIGDLTESRLKRAANVKDSSHLFPGHGGVFDRFDALILASPAFYIYLILLEIGGYVSF